MQDSPEVICIYCDEVIKKSQPFAILRVVAESSDKSIEGIIHKNCLREVLTLAEELGLEDIIVTQEKVQ